MKAHSRHLFGEILEPFLLTVPGDDEAAYEKLFKGAIRLVREHDPLSLTTNGIYFNSGSNELELELILSLNRAL